MILLAIVGADSTGGNPNNIKKRYYIILYHCIEINTQSTIQSNLKKTKNIFLTPTH
jgi:hypothetical protein